MKNHFRLVCYLIVLGLLLVFVGCGSSQQNDETFIKNVQKGLNARWTLTEKEPDSFGSYLEKKQAYTKYVEAEINAIGDIGTYSFNDEQLESLAKRYYAALNSQLEGIQYMGSDDTKYNQLFSTDGYYERARIIYQLVNNYGLSINSNHAQSLDDLVSKGRTLLDLDEVKKSMTSIISGDIVLESLGGTDYELLIKNDSSYDLSNATIEFRFYNEKDVLVDTTTAYLNSWTPGATNQCSVYENKEFSRVEARISIYDNRLYDYLCTEYYPIEYVNNMIIEVKLKTSLPRSYNYTSGKTLTTTCTVDSFHFETGYWSNGKASGQIMISGTKTFDAKGNSYSRGARVGWKLYDAKGTVIDSGTIITSDIRVGESFKDSSSYISNLEPGTYQIELLNVG